MNFEKIIDSTEKHVTDLYESNQQVPLEYHNLQHTQVVLARIKEIASHYKLTHKEMFVVVIAAWFHDVGYLSAEPPVHEEKSIELMKDFLKDQMEDEKLIDEIAACIMATKPGIEPENLACQILCDADTFNLGTKEFNHTNKLVLAEAQLRYGNISKGGWYEKTLTLMKEHKFYTDYCKDLLNDRKKKNIKKLKKSLKKKGVTVPGKKKLVEEHSNFATKGIQTMLRLTSENHMKLSDMADGKANILISVNAIIISVILTVLLRRLQVDTYLTIPTILFLGVSLITIVVSILATRPKIIGGTFRDEDVFNKKTNLLFFGNFCKRPLEDYEKAMIKMMGEPDYLYTSIIKDIYTLGSILERKYRLIRWAYNIFMIGIIISVVAFGLAVFFHSTNAGIMINAKGLPY